MSFLPVYTLYLTDSFAGVYCFGKGVFNGPSKSGMEFAYNRLTRLQTGNFVYPKLMAWEGALGVVPSECDGLVVSPEFPVFKIDQARVLPETLDVYFRTPISGPLYQLQALALMSGEGGLIRRISSNSNFHFHQWRNNFNSERSKPE